jgi:protein-arginine kinase activator protein McsA
VSATAALESKRREGELTARFRGEVTDELLECEGRYRDQLGAATVRHETEIAALRSKLNTATQRMREQQQQHLAERVSASEQKRQRLVELREAERALEDRLRTSDWEAESLRDQVNG